MRALIQSKSGRPYNISATIAATTFDRDIALGNYRPPPTLHAKMIAARWHEIRGLTATQEEAETIDSPAFLNQV